MASRRDLENVEKANARVFGGVHLLSTAAENNQAHVVKYLMEETNAVAEIEQYDMEGYTQSYKLQIR